MDIEQKKRFVLIAFTAGLAAFIVYLLTLAPDLVWQDQGDYQVLAAQCQLRQPGDVVRVHPLFIVTAHLLGRFTPLSYAYAANLTSAIFSAIGISALTAIMLVMTRRVLPAILAAGVCCFGHTYWFMATQAQTYAMSNTLMILGILYTILYAQSKVKLNLYVASFFFGLGLSVHNMSQIAFVVMVGYAFYCLYKKRVSMLDAVICLFFWLLGGGVLIYVMILDHQSTGSWVETIQSAIYGKWGKAVFNSSGIVFLLKRSVQFLILNFPTPLALLAIPGLIWGRRVVGGEVYAILLSSLIFYIMFAVRYDVPNQNHFFMPAYILLSIFIGLGFSVIRKRITTADWVVIVLLVVAIGPTYAGIRIAAQERGFKWGSNFRHIPYRSLYRYYIEPWQHDQVGPRKMVTEIFRVLPDGAVLVVDSTPYSAFEYVIEVDGQRPDIVLVDLNDYQTENYLEQEVFFLLDSELYLKKIEAGSSLSSFGEMAEGEVIYKLVRG